MASTSFDAIEYLGNGNTVRVRIAGFLTDGLWSG